MDEPFWPTFLFPVLSFKLKWSDLFYYCNCVMYFCITMFWFVDIAFIKEIPFIENFLFFEIRANLSWLRSILRFIYFHSNAQYKLCYLYNIDCSNIFSDNWVTINLTHCLVHFEVEVSFGFSQVEVQLFFLQNAYIGRKLSQFVLKNIKYMHISSRIL